MTLAALAAAAFAGGAYAQGRDHISIVGSSTVFPFASAVVEEFSMTTGFAPPVIEQTGTGGGLKLFCAGIGVEHPDIATASRRIKDSEIAACVQAGVADITEIKIGYDGIVLAQSNESGTMSVTREQIFLALAKEVPQDGQIAPNPYTVWSQIDPSLPNIAIEVYGPPPTSGTRDAFVELVMDAGCAAFPEIAALDDERKEAVCRTLREDGLFIEAGENDNLIVNKLAANSGAVGILGYSFLEENTDMVHGATIDGVAPTFEAIAAGEYPVSRSLYFYVKNAHADAIPGLREFVQAFGSEAAIGPDGYLSDIGLIPLHDDELAETIETARSLTPMTM